MIGIYKIENLLNHKVYIGQSVDICRRWRDHRKAYKDENNDKVKNSHLYRSIQKYGIENFEFSVIEECSVAELNERERYWISYYDSFFNGYNLTLGGDSSRAIEKKETVIGIIQDLKTTNLKHAEIAMKWKVSSEMVQGINTGRYWKQDNQEYPIQERTKKKSKVINRCCDCGKEISKGAERCVQCESKNRIKPKKITREELKEYIRTKSFLEIGRMYGVSDNAIRKWCDSYNLPRKKREINSYTDEEWEKI